MNCFASFTKKFFSLVATIAISATISACGPSSETPEAPDTAAPRVSKLGEYQGYSEPVYDGYERSSVYVPTRDGTRLAMDIYRPTKNGVVEEEPLPVIWTHHRYTRARERDGKVYHIANTSLDLPGWELAKIISYGYVAASVDVRGAAASFGERRDYFPPEEARDAYDVTEWLAEQPWSDGNIGMYARSYLGITQYFAAAESPPHLKTIFPAMSFADSYQETWPGGVYAGQALEVWGHAQNPPAEDYEKAGESVMPVDNDPERVLLKQARAEHQQGWDFVNTLRSTPFRDSLDKTGVAFHEERSVISRYKEINEWGGSIYHRTGWYDGFTSGPFFLNASLDVPQKMVIGPWFHDDHYELNVDIEHVRWYDYWLKGIDNGIMDEPAIHYYTMGAPKESAWQSTDVWPLENQQITAFYFDATKSGSVESVNDGTLIASMPAEGGTDDLAVDYSATLGEYGRLIGSITNKARSCPVEDCDLDLAYPDLHETMDEKSLTYTTTPLDSDVELTGHPVIHLYLSASQPDADVLVYLEEVHEDGFSQYVTEGKARISHRKTQDSPYNRLGLPWHRSYAEDVEPLPVGETAELAFDLLPISNIFDKGHRIRVTVSGADKDSVEPVQLPQAPVVTVHRGADQASYISLPVIPAEIEKTH